MREHKWGTQNWWSSPFTFTYYWTNRKIGKIMAMGFFSFNNLERTHWTGIFVGISTQKASCYFHRSMHGKRQGFKSNKNFTCYNVSFFSTLISDDTVKCWALKTEMLTSSVSYFTFSLPSFSELTNGSLISFQIWTFLVIFNFNFLYFEAVRLYKFNCYNLFVYCSFYIQSHFIFSNDYPLIYYYDAHFFFG